MHHLNWNTVYARSSNPERDILLPACACTDVIYKINNNWNMVLASNSQPKRSNAPSPSSLASGLRNEETRWQFFQDWCRCFEFHSVLWHCHFRDTKRPPGSRKHFYPSEHMKKQGELANPGSPRKLLLKWRRTTRHFVSCAFVPVVDWWMTFNLNSQSSKLGRFPRSLQSTVTQTKQQVQVKWHTLKQSQYNNNNKSMCTTPVKKFTLTASI